MDIVKSIINEVDSLKDEMAEMCSSLVKINTVNPYAGMDPVGSEKDGQMFIKPILEDMGGDTRLFEPPDDIFSRMGVIGPAGRSWEGRPNLVTEFRFGRGRSIILNSHMDTVDVAGMKIEPFSGEISNGIIYGRGASDDKGGMVSGIGAIKAVLKFADDLTGSIIHESVVGEECSGSGAGTLACCLEGISGDEAVVIDGGGLKVDRGCQGCLTADVLVRGRAGHAASGGVNAIDKACIVKNGIDRFRDERLAEHPGCPVNLGVFRSGVHPAVVPGSAVLSLNIVYSISEAARNGKKGKGWNGLSVRETFNDTVLRADTSDEWLDSHRSEVKWVKDLVPFETPEDAPVVRSLCRAYRAVTGTSQVPDIMSAWADGANIARYAGIPTVLFGPGTENAGHSDSESVRIDDIVTCAKILAVYLYNRLSRRTEKLCSSKGCGV